jgi:hypothetical protein
MGFRRRPAFGAGCFARVRHHRPNWSSPCELPRKPNQCYQRSAPGDAVELTREYDGRRGWVIAVANAIGFPILASTSLRATGWTLAHVRFGNGAQDGAACSTHYLDAMGCTMENLPGDWRETMSRPLARRPSHSA